MVEKKGVVEVPGDVIAKKRLFFGLLKNDLEYITLDELQTKIHSQSHFSILYFVLLIVSTVVCTLGLLTNSTAVVIGGMLIAPLTWPLARVGFGMARRKPHHVYRGILLVLVSVFIGTLSAYIITTISPIKLINEEILARTSPTLMDLFIALAAGLVAATAITQRKIADSLAGVAIAVSLMPPLCTIGITLGLRQFGYAGGALLLFAINAACITLVTMLIISLNTYLRTKHFKIDIKAALINVLFIALLTIPLALYLTKYSSQLRSYRIVTTEMNEFAEQKDIFATFENISVESLDDDTVSVSADLLIPNDSAFTYQDNETLIANIESRVEKKVLLNLRIQTIIEPISKNQQDSEARISELREKLSKQLRDYNSSYKISSATVSQNVENESWVISAEILSDPELVPSIPALEAFTETFNEDESQKVELNLTFLPQLTLRSSDQTLTQEVRVLVEKELVSISDDAVVSTFSMSVTDRSLDISFIVTSANNEQFTTESMQDIKSQLESSYSRDIRMSARVIQSTNIVL